jgi:hypothetical protein
MDSKPTPAGETDGKTLFRLTDPEGYEVSLSAETWDRHIAIKHPEMARRLDLVKAAIVDPELIQEEPGRPNSVYYYRLTGEAFYRSRDVYVIVVVRRDVERRTGRIKTAHLVKDLRKKGGRVIWLRMR